MLLQFSVSNFLSLRDEVILSMAANDRDREHENMLFEFKNESVLPIAAIYGANAAGKSNVFKALATAINMIRHSTFRQVDDKMPGIIPFLFDDTSRTQPTKFDFIFIANGKKYQYGFSATQDRVIEEYLYEYKTAWASKIFERTDTKTYSFTKSNEKEFRAYVAKNTDNKLFLSTATAWNCEKTLAPYMWFSNKIDVYDVNNIEQIGMNEIEKGNDELRKYLMETLRKADFNIDAYSFKAKRITIADMKKMGLPEELAEIFQKSSPDGEGKQYEIETKHNIQLEDGTEKSYALPFKGESQGTQRMFFFAALIKAAIDEGKTVVIDEIDASMHPILVKFILNMFNNSDMNRSKAQLIFTTHDVSLLSLDFFRRDQIYFAEKSNRTGVTVLYSLDEFSPRKTENIRKGYLQGRYGAIPIIDPGDTIW